MHLQFRDKRHRLSMDRYNQGKVLSVTRYLLSQVQVSRAQAEPHGGGWEGLRGGLCL